ncbi:MAG: hypothetical protein IJX93_09540, partial [Clostridia bacterium]|nr:hypothetical protein [Clostridia bacterium]
KSFRAYTFQKSENLYKKSFYYTVSGRNLQYFFRIFQKNYIQCNFPGGKRKISAAQLTDAHEMMYNIMW